MFDYLQYKLLIITSMEEGDYCSIIKKMGSGRTLVCVKNVKQESTEEWDESMPLPGDIIEGVIEDNIADDDDDEPLSIKAKAKSEFGAQLRKISKYREEVWLKVRRGENRIKLRVCIIPVKCSKLKKRFSVRAASDDRHVAVLGDLTFEQCSELQEMSRRVVNVESVRFNQTGLQYDWKMKVRTYLPDQKSTVVSSILFMPLVTEHNIEPITVRTMAWFSAAVSSGIPLVFVNIQTEHIITPLVKEKVIFTGKEMRWGRQENSSMKGIRLWFLPGIAEISLELIPEPGEARFGMEIRRTEEGFISVYSVTKGTAADRAGIGRLQETANRTGHLVVISRLEGKSLMPSSVSTDGLINCCDQAEIKNTLFSATEQLEGIKLHIMSWPNQRRSSEKAVAATLRPPY